MINCAQYDANWINSSSIQKALADESAARMSSALSAQDESLSGCTASKARRCTALNCFSAVGSVDRFALAISSKDADSQPSCSDPSRGERNPEESSPTSSSMFLKVLQSFVKARILKGNNVH